MYHAGQRAWIITRMPPGITDSFRDQVCLRLHLCLVLKCRRSNYYDQVVQRYRDTIAGQFFGHTQQGQVFVDYKSSAGNRQCAVGRTSDYTKHFFHQLKTT